MYPTNLIWLGTWETPAGPLSGFHLWNRQGKWVGVYGTKSRAMAESQRV